jgi:hypothetical protein
MPNILHKRKNEAISRKKKTLVENTQKLGKLLSIDVAFLVRRNGQYTTYQSVNE